MDNKIDFVITWVDNSDLKWRKEFEYYSANEGRTINTDACRYRDWGTLRYWFRGVEKFAPWVNKIYFVTYGHLPKWLNVNNPKLVIVKHEDFIPSEYLPTFSSDAIEFFFHNIKDLSDRFVYFNDDMFLIDSVSPDRFFKKGLPCDIAGLSSIKTKGMFGCSVYLALDLIRDNFNKKESVSRNRTKWYSLKYPRLALHNLLKFRETKFTGFVNHHLPQGYLKHIYDDVWEHCEKDIHRTCSDKFRTYGDVCHWVVRYWQLASGNFTPYHVFKDGKLFSIKEDKIGDIDDCIRHQKKKIVCLNDVESTFKFKEYKQMILEAFETILPDKCSYEL